MPVFHGVSPEMNSALTAARVFRDRSKDFVNLSLYEQRIQRARKNAFDQLRQLQAERKAAPAPEMRLSAASVAVSAKAPDADDECRLCDKSSFYRYCQSNGFVYAGPEIDIPLRRPAQYPIEFPVAQAA